MGGGEGDGRRVVSYRVDFLFAVLAASLKRTPRAHVEVPCSPAAASIADRSCSVNLILSMSPFGSPDKDLRPISSLRNFVDTKRLTYFRIVATI